MSRVKMLETSEPRASIYHDHEQQAFVFRVGDEEVLSFAKGGEVKVHGRPCGSDEELFKVIREFFVKVSPEGKVSVDKKELERLRERDARLKGLEE